MPVNQAILGGCVEAGALATGSTDEKETARVQCIRTSADLLRPGSGTHVPEVPAHPRQVVC